MPYFTQQPLQWGSGTATDLTSPGSPVLFADFSGAGIDSQQSPIRAVRALCETATTQIRALRDADGNRRPILFYGLPSFNPNDPTSYQDALQLMATAGIFKSVDGLLVSIPRPPGMAPSTWEWNALRAVRGVRLLFSRPTFFLIPTDHPCASSMAALAKIIDGVYDLCHRHPAPTATGGVESPVA